MCVPVHTCHYYKCLRSNGRLGARCVCQIALRTPQYWVVGISQKQTTVRNWIKSQRHKLRTNWVLIQARCRWFRFPAARHSWRTQLFFSNCLQMKITHDLFAVNRTKRNLASCILSINLSECAQPATISFTRASHDAYKNATLFFSKWLSACEF